MTYSDMTDDELVGPRTIISCTECGDGTWDVALSCGHDATFVMQPRMSELLGCAQCITIALERHHAKTDR